MSIKSNQGKTLRDIHHNLHKCNQIAIKMIFLLKEKVNDKFLIKKYIYNFFFLKQIDFVFWG